MAGPSYILYSDRNTFHQENDAKSTLSEIMARNGISGRARLKVEVGARREYRVDGSGFEFSITTVQN